jgi:hypothetical protein
MLKKLFNISSLDWRKCRRGSPRWSETFVDLGAWLESSFKRVSLPEPTRHYCRRVSATAWCCSQLVSIRLYDSFVLLLLTGRKWTWDECTRLLPTLVVLPLQTSSCILTASCQKLIRVHAKHSTVYNNTKLSTLEGYWLSIPRKVELQGLMSVSAIHRSV